MDHRPVVLKSVPARRFGTDHYAMDAVELGFFEVRRSPPAASEAEVRVISARVGQPPPAPREPEVQVALPRQTIQAQANWPTEAIREALSGDPACPPYAVACEGPACLLWSVHPACSLDRCGTGIEFEGLDVLRMSWEGSGRPRVVACALIPADDPSGQGMAWAAQEAARRIAEIEQKH